MPANSSVSSSKKVENMAPSIDDDVLLHIKWLKYKENSRERPTHKVDSSSQTNGLRTARNLLTIVTWQIRNTMPTTAG
ncbi:hypothetical protein AYI70_g1033 [Smittium culicis]|uniref:Uncharacterized protein n=1 Tax=Smittium culicis TaxID=133412 RepID=A0A1R1YE74_9FUNG|nr:hypothetical protein AYI70_g1033 [Smittium culicis]